jgi:colicin import membrane protein
MSTDQPLRSDPVQAAEILAALLAKDQDEKTCRYPTCYDARQPATGTGRPSAYCGNPEHNAVNNHRARQYLLKVTAAAGGTPESPSKHDPSSAPPVESLRNSRSSVINHITLLQSHLERYVTTLANMSDPDVSAAQIQAALDQANARIAEAQQRVSAEQALRLAGETALLAAQEEARSEREAAEQAIEQLEEAEAAAQREREEAERRIGEIQQDRDDALERMRVETQQQRAALEQQAREAIAHAQAETSTAQEEARQANVAALDARAQAATAERLVNEAHASLQRERAEIDRLRGEHAEAIAEARRRAEADRAEARTALERERAEVDRLRTELTATRKQAEQATVRADTFATLNDELRKQLVQAQAKERPMRQ